jgi:hypothetical protein
MEALKGPGAETAEFTRRAARGPCEFAKEVDRRITNATTSFKRQGNKPVTLGETTRLPFAILGLGSLDCGKTLLGRRLGVGCGITSANVTHNVGEAAWAIDDDIRAQVVENLVPINFHPSTTARSQADEVGAANQGVMPEAGAVFGG